MKRILIVTDHWMISWRFIEGRDDDIDRNTPGKNKNPRSILRVSI